MADIDDLINTAVDQQPTAFANAFDELMRDRIAGRIDDEKIGYAQQMFQTDEDDSDDIDIDLSDDDDLDIDDFDEEDFDIDDDEFEDEDFDLELDDSDLEEDEDDGQDA